MFVSFGFLTHLAVHLQVDGGSGASAVLHETSDLGRPQEFAGLALLEAVHVVRAHAFVRDQHLSKVKRHKSVCLWFVSPYVLFKTIKEKKKYQVQNKGSRAP